MAISAATKAATGSVGLSAGAFLLSMFEDPSITYKFSLQIDGVFEANFLECTGLSIKRDVKPWKEGGQNEYIHQLPDRVSYPNVTLKRGVTSSQALYDWVNQGLFDGKVAYKDVSIVLFNQMGFPLKWWSLTRAMPVKWTGGELKTGDGGTIALESIELVHHGIFLSKATVPNAMGF